VPNDSCDICRFHHSPLEDCPSPDEANSAGAEQGDWETPCPARPDKTHCTCWYDGDTCCSCGDRRRFNHAK
jgi:hypothetical protein